MRRIYATAPMFYVFMPNHDRQGDRHGWISDDASDYPIRTNDFFRGEPVLVLATSTHRWSMFGNPTAFAHILHARYGVCMISLSGLVGHASDGRG